MQKSALHLNRNGLFEASTNGCSNQAVCRLGHRHFSRALHRAINDRQLQDIEPLTDEDVDWAIYGPIDMFPFLGARRGKSAVMEVCRQIADNVRILRHDRETVMLGVDSAATMLRYSLTALDTNKPISLRLAHFAQFKA